MNTHTMKGVEIAGTGVYRTGLSQACDRRPDFGRMSWNLYGTDWLPSTIGALIRCDEPMAKNDPSTTSAGEVALHELAFMVKSHTHGVDDDTPCDFNGKRLVCKVLRVNGVLYRTQKGFLYEQREDEL